MPLTVRYIGPGEAILAGTYIQQGETRSVTPAQLQAALADHPAGFAIVAGDNVPAPLDQPPSEQSKDLSEPAGQAEDLNEPAAAPAEAVDLREPAATTPRRRRPGDA